ncbi:hypothetical protein JYU34_008152 [Plutella xylostella]|uniref:Metalloendopeptidase n=1 Tax=Plutella xylostella TaxID=51655 RepID=A0ABQ7QNV5_PLUXY|nr:hypothetical protein JYU34_008152 [Plutella xylostella]
MWLWIFVITSSVFKTFALLIEKDMTLESYIFWPKATIPFYINRDHFDDSQAQTIMEGLESFQHQSCLKFKPVLAPPEGRDHVLVIQNPEGLRQCVVGGKGHLKDGPHFLNLPYGCLESPYLEMMIMKSLGFSFEHNRKLRDLYIQVHLENVEPGMEELFTKDVSLPPELRELPYDVNSVMHFDLREFSKNGHRTITIKDPDTTQERDGLSNIDLKKINKVYREECDARDRTEKIEICQRYPGVARRKRELTDKPFDILDHMSIKTLAPKPEQKPQPVKPKIEAIKNVEQLRMDQDIMDIKELAYKVVTMVLTGIRRKQCDDDTTDMSDPSRDVLGIEEAIVNHANFMIDLAQQSGQAFCDSVNTVDAFVNFVRSHPQFGNIRRKRQTNDGIQKPGSKYTAKVNNDRVLSNDSVTSAPIDNVKTINLKASTITKDILHQATEDTATSNVSEKVSVPTKIGDFISGLQSNGTAGEGNIKKILRDGDDEDSNTEDEGIDHHGKVRAVPKLTKENEDFYSQRKWPDGVVRYVIKDNPKYNTQDLRKRINEVNAILKTRTCIYFEEITSKAGEERWLDYIVLDSEADDYITGRTGGTQIFGCKELFEGNHHKQLTAMMMMTILGFYFEVCRPDRDQYIRVHTRHIRADKLHHFEKLGPEALISLPYDYASATHPPHKFWRTKKGLATVATFKKNDPNGAKMRRIGENARLLSDIDIAKINALYGTSCFTKREKKKK